MGASPFGDGELFPDVAGEIGIGRFPFAGAGILIDQVARFGDDLRFGLAVAGPLFQGNLDVSVSSLHALCCLGDRSTSEPSSVPLEMHGASGFLPAAVKCNHPSRRRGRTS